MNYKSWIAFLIGCIMVGVVGLWAVKTFNPKWVEGRRIDSLNGVYVFYNGAIDNVNGRNTTADGYNLGLRYQCVEFVKRYYYEHLDHKMPDSYGHAKDFFDKRLQDGEMNTARALIQYTNPSQSKPRVDDLLIFDKSSTNEYGHVAIISDVGDDSIEIIQQNAGPSSESRDNFNLDYENNKWEIDNKRILGWLRKRN